MLAFPRLGALLLACVVLIPLQASAWERGRVERFATLPAGTANPEGITVDRHGDVYVTTFDVQGEAPGKLLVFDDRGRLKRKLEVSGSSRLLLGVAFHPATRELLVVDFGAGNVLRVDPRTGASSVFSAIPGGGLNALAFDGAGNVYISDSGRGIIWRTGPAGGSAENWKTDPLLATAGFPPFGANGMDFNSDESALFAANTGEDTVVRIQVDAVGNAGPAEVFVNSINGADGLFLDEHDNVWVCANQADEIVVVDKTGRAIAKLGDFDGLRNGAPVGLLFPASLVRSGGWIYVTNLSLDLRLFGLPQAVDSQWTGEVSTHTISRIRARIPRVSRDLD